MGVGHIVLLCLFAISAFGSSTSKAWPSGRFCPGRSVVMLRRLWGVESFGFGSFESSRL